MAFNLAFNRKIAREAKGDFPGGVDCRTTHSLAARAVRARNNYSRDKMFTAIRAPQLAAVLELKAAQFENAVTITEVQQAYLLLSTVRRFCQSDDQEIQEHHTPMTGGLRGLKAETRADVHRWVQRQAKALWMRMCDAGDEIPLGHDGYLKLWSLGSPCLDYDYVLLDEAQDTNPVVLSVLQAQDTQMVYVGDRHQQIYEWRGAVNAMAKIATNRETKLTQSFRFGPAIAAEATLILSKLGEKSRLTGNERIPSRISETSEVDAVLARTNATVIADALAANETGRKPFIVGGTQELERLVSDVFNLLEGRPGSHPDFFGFSNWTEVVTFASTDEGEELRPFVTLVEKNGPKRLWAAIKSSALDMEGADVCISTAHKAKGAEWRSVRIADDFSGSTSDGEPIPESEARLFYVAITRAKEILSISPTLLSMFTQAPRFVSDKEAAEARRRLRTQPVSSPPPQPTPTRHAAPAGVGKVALRVTVPKLAAVPLPLPSRVDAAGPSRDDVIPAPMPQPKSKRGFLSTLLGFGSRDRKA